jgi:P-type Ca2+ transporter type 2C
LISRGNVSSQVGALPSARPFAFLALDIDDMELARIIGREGLPVTAHASAVSEVLSKLKVSREAGLQEDEAKRRLRLYGPNKLMARGKVSAFAVLLHQLKSPVVYLLASAALLAVYFGDWKEAIAIAIVLVLNALIGFLTELKAARSMEALRALGTHRVRVRREGVTRLIAAEELVPGDIIVIEAGDAIAADLRIAEASNLAADESTLTGESVSVAKQVSPVPVKARTSDRSSMLFKGTSITRGSGLAAVVTTGLDTELGQITRLVEEAEPEKAPLERKLAKLSGQLLWVILTLIAVIAGLGFAEGKPPFLVAETAIALAVAAIPEGLPIVATFALARIMWRMARQNALVEHLSAVETLGAATVIFTDKTGTLTENRMAVCKFWLPAGEINPDVAEPDRLPLLRTAVLCNGATLGETAGAESGDPIELALLQAGRAAGLEKAELLRQAPMVRKYAFDTSTNMMATVHSHEGRFLFCIKGAPEAVLAVSNSISWTERSLVLDSTSRGEWLHRAGALGQEGFRILACAIKETDTPDAPPFEDLTFLGLIGLADPPRADVAGAIEACKEAGIQVIMVTGDHAMTARAIGRSVGLGSSTHCIEGRELARLLEREDDALFKTSIFARVSPAEKLHLVRAYQSGGHVVAMTGDGVNDAPALRQADIGIAMGLRGTDVAREAAGMILLDDAFPTIVRAIREGRVIFGNIRRFAAYLLSCNLAEVLVVGTAILSALPLPITPLQILFLNLVTDVFPAFALAMGEGERDAMRRPPRDPREPILGREHWLTIFVQSLGLAAGTFGALALARWWLQLDEASAVTVTFLTLAFAELWHIFNMRNTRSGLWKNEIMRNPWAWGALALCAGLLIVAIYVPPFGEVLDLVPPDLAMWAVILGMSMGPLIAWQVALGILERWRPASHS